MSESTGNGAGVLGTEAMHNPLKVGENLYLRHIEPGDAIVLSRSSHMEPETEFLGGGRVPMSVLSFEWWIQRINTANEPTESVFAICRLSDDAFLGTTSLRHIDRRNGTAETGIGLVASDHRGRGIGTEAKHLLLSYAFQDLDLHAVSATIFEGNLRSIRAVEKQGYELAGRLSATQVVRGIFRDTLVYSLTRQDWERNQAE